MSDTIAYVWSFSNKMQDIPYRIDRHGEPKVDGGRGVYWTCTCPAFVNRGGKTCKHLISLRSLSKDRAILNDDRFQITDIGKKILKIV
jgi:hypothetical protein